MRAREARLWGAAFVLLEVVLLATVPVLAFVGFQAVLDTTEGQVVDPVLDPAEPGYEARLEPTPVQVVLGLDDAGGLSWITVLVLSGLDQEGGSVLFVPPATATRVDGEGQTTLAAAWEGGENRSDVVLALARILGGGLEDVVEIDAVRLAGLLGPVSPLAVTNPDVVPGFDQGDLALEAAAVPAFLEARDPNESDLSRLARHELVWRAWLDAVAASSDPDVVPGEVEVGIGRFVRGLAAGPVTFDLLPGQPFLTPAPEDGSGEGGERSVVEAEVYAPDFDAAPRLFEDLVPFPVSAEPGDRPRVEVLDGAGADGLGLRVARDVVRAGGQVELIGNADRFDVGASRVIYYDPALEEVAAAIAESVGAAAAELDAGPNPNDLVDIVVVVGSELASAYGLAPRG